jgi:uncharacterized membrane protein YfcA
MYDGMMANQMIAALMSGGLVGFSLGFIGGGGSILATPLLLYVVGVKDVHTAVGTGALAVSVNAYLNLGSHAVKGHVWWRCAAIFAIVGALAALAGSSLGKRIDGGLLLIGFAVVMLVVSLLMFRPLRIRQVVDAKSLDGKAHLKLCAIALVAGFCSGLFGIGGGFLIVPGLMFSVGMPVLNAVGSSLLAVGTFGLASALNYALSGMIDWQVAMEFILGGVIGGVIGMALCLRLSGRQEIVKRALGAVVLFTALCILFSRS